jgi:hypothetical protein
MRQVYDASQPVVKEFSPTGCQQHRQKTLEAILTILFELAERQPVLFILEDLE